MINNLIILIPIFIIYIIVNKINNHKFNKSMTATLANFQDQINSINASFTSIGTLVSNLNAEIATLTNTINSTMSPADAEAALAGITSAAIQFASIVPVQA